MNPRREVVITGVGVVSPIGAGAGPFWNALIERRSGVSVRPRFEDFESPYRIAAAVRDFDPKEYVKPRKALKIMCGPIQYGCAAAAMAMEDAGLDSGQMDPDRVGTIFGTETFFADPSEVADVFRKCIINKDYQHDRWGEFAMREIQPLWMLKYLPNMAASHISIAIDARGPSNSICQGEASGQLALIEAADLIGRGVADVVLAGGTGSQMELTAMLYRGTAMLSKRFMEPELASRPFDRDRDGMVVGEGAGAIVLESAEHAAARSARILARVKGWSRGHRELHREDLGESLEQHFQTAIERSGCVPGQIDLVNANASGNLRSDRLEAQAIANVLGQTPVVAHKGNFGNLGPGTSTIEMIGAILALENNCIPATLNCDQVDDACGINVVQQTDQREESNRIRRVLKSSYSSTGQITALVIER